MRDTWGIVGAIVSLLAIGVTVAFFVFGRNDQKKALGVELVSRSVLVDERIGGSTGSLQLMYAGQPIPNYAIVQVRVSNSGSQPIRSSDYEEQISLRFANAEKVLSAKKVSSDPDELNVETWLSGKSVTLEGVLLNPGDSYVIDARVVPEAGQTPVARVTGRIVGVKHIELKEMSTRPSTNRRDKWIVVIVFLQAIVAFVMSALQRRMSRISERRVRQLTTPPQT